MEASVAPSIILGRSLSPPSVPLGVVQVVSDAQVRQPGAIYTPMLWQLRTSSRERPRQERDSLRSRSKEGRPGSRKHRRWTRSVELVGSLRRVMAKFGEDHHYGDDADNFVDQVRPQARPSVFQQLLESEGPGALEAWERAEASRRSPRGRRHPKDAVQLAEEQHRAVRRAFGENFQWIQRSSICQEMLADIEVHLAKAFATMPDMILESPQDAEQTWLLLWDGIGLTTKSGSPPAAQLELSGLDSMQRKVVHQLARVLGLHSESVLDTETQKVVCLRPTRASRCGLRGSWSVPFSVSKVLTTSS